MVTNFSFYFYELFVFLNNSLNNFRTSIFIFVAQETVATADHSLISIKQRNQGKIVEQMIGFTHFKDLIDDPVVKMC